MDHLDKNEGHTDSSKDYYLLRDKQTQGINKFQNAKWVGLIVLFLNNVLS